MTIKEIAEITGAHYNTVYNKIKKEYSELIRNGKRTELTESDAIKIIKDIKKKNLVNLNENVKVPTQNSEAEDKFQRLQELVLLQAQTTQSLINALSKNIQQPKQIELIEQDYYSILAYCNLKQIKMTTSEAIRYGKELVKLSNEKGYEVRKVKDERYGHVNSYSIDVLEQVIVL